MNQKDITNQVVQIGKRYKTRSGLEVEVLKVDLKGTKPVLVVVTDTGLDYVLSLHNNGSYLFSESSHCDLIEVSPYDEFQIDDKVGVSNDGTNWHKRHFAGVSSDGRAMVFDKGMTSWSSSGRKSPWNYCVRDGGCTLTNRSKEMFKVGDRVEWCRGGNFEKYGDSSNPYNHDFGEVLDFGEDGVWCKWESDGAEQCAPIEQLRKESSKEPTYTKAPTRKNLKLELRVKGLELTVKVLEQDEVDTCKDGSYFAFESSNRFTIYSAEYVEVVPCSEIYIKGVDTSESCTHKFTSETELKDYITRLKQAVKEFNAAGGFAKTPEETVEIIE